MRVQTDRFPIPEFRAHIPRGELPMCTTPAWRPWSYPPMKSSCRFHAKNEFDGGEFFHQLISRFVVVTSVNLLGNRQCVSRFWNGKSPLGHWREDHLVFAR